jgi:hypothetical protein
MSKWVLAFIIVLLPLFINAQIQSIDIESHIKYLSSDKLKGRGTGTKQEKKAAKYLANYFKELHLLPKGTNHYYYNFTFKKNPNPHDTVTTKIKERKGRNVVAFLDNKAPYTIVIGAHYDHLGLGYDYNSLDANPKGKIHNGADDNASGVAGVLALAKYFATNQLKEPYNFLFICFSGEELGLIGSKKFCENPTIPLQSINYMINLDMIGRLNEETNKLMIYGIGTTPVWGSILDLKNQGFDLKKDSSGIGPSDQTSFYLKDIPVLHFFTGQHSDYHKPTDDFDKINISGEIKVLNYIVSIINETLKITKLKFTPTKAPETQTTRFKVTLGIMPDYTFEGKGVKIDGVTQGKPAHTAGLQKNDIIVKLGDYVINTMDDYMKALSKINKGDTVEAEIVREKSIIKTTISF